MEIFQFWKNDTEKQTNSVLDNFHNYFSRMLKTCNITIKIIETSKNPSDATRGYIWAEIVPKALFGFIAAGHQLPNNKTGLEIAYKRLKVEGGFYEVIKTDIKGKVFKDIVFESFSNKGDQKRANEFIEFCIQFIAEWFGIVCETPEEYKIKRGIKE